MQIWYWLTHEAWLWIGDNKLVHTQPCVMWLNVILEYVQVKGITWTANIDCNNSVIDHLGHLLLFFSLILFFRLKVSVGRILNETRGIWHNQSACFIKCKCIHSTAQYIFFVKVKIFGIFCVDGMNHVNSLPSVWECVHIKEMGVRCFRELSSLHLHNHMSRWRGCH